MLGLGLERMERYSGRLLFKDGRRLWTKRDNTSTAAQ